MIEMYAAMIVIMLVVLAVREVINGFRERADYIKRLTEYADSLNDNT